MTVAGPRPAPLPAEPFLDDGKLVWREGAGASPRDRDILRPVDDPSTPRAAFGC